MAEIRPDGGINWGGGFRDLTDSEMEQLGQRKPRREVVTECVCGQLPELEPLQRLCEACDAEPGEACAPDCIGLAAELDRQQEARQAPARGPMPTVTYDGITYKVRSRKTVIPDLDAMDRLGALIWINQNTTRRGAGINTRPNPLAGLGAVLSVDVR